MHISLEKLERGYLLRVYSEQVTGDYIFIDEKEVINFINEILPQIILKKKLKKSKMTDVEIVESEELKKKKEGGKKRKRKTNTKK